ncbi:MAG TPA: hypothetical protein VGR37_08980 [Longimicrobiaceae bacterium]|nr:hypothetical protein [Longimicrobiaceae bacterium]
MQFIQASKHGMAGTVRIGDIVEITTRKGLAYAQYTHKHPQFGALLRVLRGLHSERPANFHALAEEHPQFSTFFPLQAAWNRGIVQIVSNVPVAEHAAAFPIFRDGVQDPYTGRVRWWLWDGETEWSVDELTAEQEKAPIREIINDTLLIERIESNWSSERDSF